MRIPVLSQAILKLRQQALLCEIQWHAEQIQGLCHALIEMSEPGDAIAFRAAALRDALEE
jgi:hypothetical protein